jgi:energy-coupling factor transporter transmembrane protein EcfT
MREIHGPAVLLFCYPYIFWEKYSYKGEPVECPSECSQNISSLDPASYLSLIVLMFIGAICNTSWLCTSVFLLLSTLGFLVFFYITTNLFEPVSAILTLFILAMTIGAMYKTELSKKLEFLISK